MAAIPTSIGRYQVQRAIGQGAMGAVYLAEDPLLKRRLAIKVVLATGDERTNALERFKREAEISAMLNHPNIVTIFDVGEEPALGPFLAMEYVEGCSLGKYVREGSLDLETRFAVLIQAMRGLRTAHRHAVVHRDIKPDNILVGEDGRVKLMDFGIAKTMAPSLTGAGEFLGSPAYSAPELLRGSEPTPSSDRYAFAVTAFELLTGLLPHPGANVAAVIGHILLEPPVIPAGMPGEVARVFRQAMAADPEDRPSSLMEFMVALVDTYPLEPLAQQRINELFRHDDHAGDVVPMRRRALGPGQEAAAPGVASGPGRDSSPIRDSGSQVRSSAGRSTPTRPMQAYRPQAPTVKIELQDHPPAERPTQAWRPPVKEESGLHRTAVKMLKWFVVILVAGQICIWVYNFVRSTQVPH